MNGFYRFRDDLNSVPETEGVYLLAEMDSEDSIVYAGRADNLHERLLSHPDPQNSCLQRKVIKYFTYEETNDSEAREDELIEKYDPDCNHTNS